MRSIRPPRSANALFSIACGGGRSAVSDSATAPTSLPGTLSPVFDIETGDFFRVFVLASRSASASIDLMGDGIAVAARLEDIGEPDSVYGSGAAYG
jgi:hypothetical protein